MKTVKAEEVITQEPEDPFIASVLPVSVELAQLPMAIAGLIDLFPGQEVCLTIDKSNSLRLLLGDEEIGRAKILSPTGEITISITQVATTKLLNSAVSQGS